LTTQVTEQGTRADANRIKQLPFAKLQHLASIHKYQPKLF